jgi:hypothetical protein
VDDIAVLLSGSLLLINNSNPMKMLVEESTRSSSAKIQMGVAKLTTIENSYP